MASQSIKAGDTVESELTGGEDLVVVDVITDDGEEFAILRTKEDKTLENPIARKVEEVTVTGHLHEIDGWVEDALGEWRQVEG